MAIRTITCVCRDNHWTNDETGEDATELVEELVANISPPLSPALSLMGMGGNITVTIETE